MSGFIKTGFVNDKHRVNEIEYFGENPIKLDDTVWIDIYGRVVSKNLDTAVGHWDWIDGYFRADDSANVTNDNHALYVLTQLNHYVDYRPGSYTSLHIHWLQEQDPASHNPKWKLQYKVISTGGAVPSTWTDGSILVQNAFPYNNAGAQDQLTAFNHINIEGLEMSSRILFKLWRDGTNVLDTYQQYLYCSDFDIHVPYYLAGSKTELSR